MHRFPHQHYPHPVRLSLDAARSFDSCGDLAAVNTYFDGSNQAVEAGGGGDKLVLRCQYGNKSSSGCVLRAEEPAIPFLLNKRKAKRRVKQSTCESIQQVPQPTGKSLYGGCLSYAPISSAECEGLLFYPKAPDLKGFSVHQISLLSNEKQGKGPVYTTSTSVLEYPVESCVRQIETVPSSNKDGIITALRTDNLCHLLTVTFHDGNLTHKRARTLPCDHKPTAVALSPYLKGEWLISHNNGTIQLKDTDLMAQSFKLPGDPDTGQPCWSHFGSHPRLVLAHQPKKLHILDVRIPSSTPTSTCLMSLPNEYLASNQEIHVTRQHPVNHFYHFVATQDILVLVDERFPKYQVLQWHHLLDSPPSCIDIVSQALPTDDLAVVSSFSSGQSHCFQFSCLNGETPVSTSPQWRVSTISSWLNVLPQLPVSHGLDDVKSRLQRPLVGMCAARHCDGKGLAVFQVSEVGDVFQHSFYSSLVDADPPHKMKTAIPGPEMEDIQLSEESLKICKRWIDNALLENKKRRKETLGDTHTLNFKRSSNNKILSDLKKITTPHPNCQICRTKTPDMAHPPKTPMRGKTCPACGVQINAKLSSCLKRTRTSLTTDIDIITSKMVSDAKRSIEDLPGKQLQYSQYKDAIGLSLLKHWQLTETQEQVSNPSSDTPLAHPSSSSSQPTIPNRLKGFLDSSHQLTQARLNTSSKNPQKKITARRKLLNPNFTLGF